MNKKLSVIIISAAELIALGYKLKNNTIDCNCSECIFNILHFEYFKFANTICQSCMTYDERNESSPFGDFIDDKNIGLDPIKELVTIKMAHE